MTKSFGIRKPKLSPEQKKAALKKDRDEYRAFYDTMIKLGATRSNDKFTEIDFDRSTGFVGGMILRKPR